MQGGHTPAGEISPQSISEQTCLPDIQPRPNATLSNTSGSGNESTCSPAPNTAAPDITEIAPTDNSGQSLQAKGNRYASFLVITHVIEVTAIVLVILLRFLPQELKSSSSLSNPPPSTTSSLPSGRFEEISSLVLGLHVGILIVPLMFVTVISLHWVLRVQDFSGKIVARLVCWLLHFFQSSLVWRFLKLQIAFDPGDLAELGMLRFIQLYVHILPFLVMHVATILSYPRSLGIALSLAFALLLSVVITVVVSTVIRQKNQASCLPPATVSQMYHITVSKTNADTSSKHDDSKSHIMIGATTMCVLWSRVVSIAALFCLNPVWAVCLIAIHWIFAVVWLSFKKEMNSSKQIIRKSFLGYLLLWDWHIFGNTEPTSKVCFRPQLPILYYALVTSQNIAATSAWYFAKQFQNISLLYTVMLASVIVCQVIAILLMSLSYLYYSSSFLKWSNKTSSLPLSRKPSSLVTPSRKATASDATPKVTRIIHSIKSFESTSYTDYEAFNSENNENKKCVSSNHFVDEVPCQPARAETRNKDHENSTYPVSLTPRLLSNHLNSSIFSYANDIIQPTTKSERSSTDNGSFNSRNTNTLHAPGHVVTDYEGVHQPHGSFSDSFSSLSCGTVNKFTASTPKGNFSGQVCINNLKRLKHRRSCQKNCCQCRTVDYVSHKCTGVKEEQDEISLREDQVLDRNSFISIEKEVSPPRVAVVRATQRFQVVCTKCLHAHDPLLTKCNLSPPSKRPPSLSYSCGGELGVGAGSSSTDYPSDTEITTTIDTLSSISAESHSTYTTWPVGKGPGLAKLLMREKGGHDYVTAWLRHQQADTTLRSDKQKITAKLKSNSNYRENPSKYFRSIKRNNHHRTRLRSPPAFVQDLETVV